MLVLTRRKDESVMVGEDVEVTVVDVRGNTVRLGISAPRSIPVHRREVYESIRRENAEKAK
jgi:carbon storage regulator